jgi:hypothetical protein
MEYRNGEFYFLSKGFCRILNPLDIAYIQDKFIPRSIHNSSFYLNEYISPNFIIINKLNENILIFYNNKFGILVDHIKIKLELLKNE